MHYVGDYVVAPKVTHDGEYKGRISDVHPHGCPEEPWWLALQENLGEFPMVYQNVRWVTILRNDPNGYDENGYAQAGAIVVPDLDEFVQKVEPFAFAHRDADLYFEEAS